MLKKTKKFLKTLIAFYYVKRMKIYTYIKAFVLFLCTSAHTQNVHCHHLIHNFIYKQNKLVHMLLSHLFDVKNNYIQTYVYMRGAFSIRIMEKKAQIFCCLMKKTNAPQQRLDW